jgi:hypothetical protein
MIRSVFFECGILQLRNKQQSELMLIYEKLILKKLKISKKFPKSLLYARKSMGGVRLLKPKTIIAISILKQYIRNYRIMNRVFSMIKISKEWLITESRYSGSPIEIKINNRYWQQS